MTKRNVLQRDISVSPERYGNICVRIRAHMDRDHLHMHTGNSPCFYDRYDSSVGLRFVTISPSRKEYQTFTKIFLPIRKKFLWSDIGVYDDSESEKKAFNKPLPPD